MRVQHLREKKSQNEIREAINRAWSAICAESAAEEMNWEGRFEKRIKPGRKRGVSKAIVTKGIKGLSIIKIHQKLLENNETQILYSSWYSLHYPNPDSFNVQVRKKLLFEKRDSEAFIELGPSGTRKT